MFAWTLFLSVLLFAVQAPAITAAIPGDEEFSDHFHYKVVDWPSSSEFATTLDREGLKMEKSSADSLPLSAGEYIKFLFGGRAGTSYQQTSYQQKAASQQATISEQDLSLRSETPGWLFLLKSPIQSEQVKRLQDLSCVGDVYHFGEGAVMAPRCSDDCSEDVLSLNLAVAKARLSTDLIVDQSLLKSGDVGLKSVDKKAAVAIKVVLCRGCRGDEAKGRLSPSLKALGCSVKLTSEQRLRVDAPNAMVARQASLLLAQDIDVIFVEKIVPFKKKGMFGSRVVSGDVVGNTTTTLLWELGIRGEEEIITVGDSGLDVDNCYFYDPSVPTVSFDGSTMSSHRKIHSYRFSVQGFSETDLVNGHGTHVVGTITGNVLSSTVAASSEQAMAEGNGIAPGAKVAVVDFEDNSLDPDSLNVPEDMAKDYFPLTFNATANSVISSNSWGASHSGYTSNAVEVDEFAFANPAFIGVFAAGNEGSEGSKTVNSPGTAKNSISVGATGNSAEGFRAPFESVTSTLWNGFTTVLIRNTATGDSTVFNATRGLNGKLDFGPSVTAALVVADPIEACSTLSSASVSGKVVIARRGTCTFSLKAQMVHDAGGVGLLIVDTSAGDTRPRMQSGSYVPIYSMMVEKTDGDSILALLESNSLEATLPVNKEYYNEDIIAYFSSIGPTLDGRVKPDVVAPGEYILAARGDGQSSAPDSSTCTASDAILRMSGTSMATPLVAGAAALIRQYLRLGMYSPGQPFNRTTGISPAGSLVKAILIASTKPVRRHLVSYYSKSNPIESLEGSAFGALNSNRTILDTTSQREFEDAFVQGYGLISPGKMLYDAHATGKGLVLAQNIAIQGGQGIVACVKTEASAERVPLRVVIVWTDPPAAPNSPSPLVSDLDLLVVEQDGTTYLGNGRAQKDSVNNVEVVDAMVKGGKSVLLYMLGWSIPISAQKFSLVVHGGIEGTQSSCPRVCPLGCSDHGQCSSGICVCNEGYSGPACQLSAVPLAPQYNSETGVTVEVTPGYWTYFVVDTSAIPSPLPNSLKLHFARISDQGDPDYYLRESKEPTFFQYSEKNINCDNCISDPVTEGEFSIPDLSTPKKIYLGIYGYCCDAATVKVFLADGSLPACNFLDCGTTNSTSAPTPSPTPSPSTNSGILPLIIVVPAAAGVAVSTAIIAAAVVYRRAKRRRRANTPVLPIPPGSVGQSERYSGRTPRVQNVVEIQ